MKLFNIKVRFLVTYVTQKIGDLSNPKFETVVTDKSPADFLVDLKNKNSNLNYAIIFCIPINKKQFNSLGDK